MICWQPIFFPIISVCFFFFFFFFLIDKRVTILISDLSPTLAVFCSKRLSPLFQYWQLNFLTYQQYFIQECQFFKLHIYTCTHPLAHKATCQNLYLHRYTCVHKTSHALRHTLTHMQNIVEVDQLNIIGFLFITIYIYVFFICGANISYYFSIIFLDLLAPFLSSAGVLFFLPLKIMFSLTAFSFHGTLFLQLTKADCL